MIRKYKFSTKQAMKKGKKSAKMISVKEVGLRLTLLGAVCVCGCFNNQTVSDDAIFHPKMFTLMQNWISDTESPVVTEINLDAINKNRNEYDFKAIKHNDEWYRYDDNKKHTYYRYKIISKNGDTYKILFQDGGTGSFVSTSEIKFEIIYRSIIVDREKKNIRILRVAAIKSIY